MSLRSSSANSNLPKRSTFSIHSAPRKRLDNTTTLSRNELDELFPEDNSVVPKVLDNFLEEDDPKKIQELFEEYQKLPPSKRGGKKKKNKTKKTPPKKYTKIISSSSFMNFINYVYTFSH